MSIFEPPRLAVISSIKSTLAVLSFLISTSDVCFGHRFRLQPGSAAGSNGK